MSPISNVFISYSRRSETIIGALSDDIETLGYDVWFDKDLSGGQIWWDQILTRIRECDVFVFALTPEALNSAACKREFEYAKALGKPIVPVLVAQGVSTNLLPPALSAIQHVDYRKQDRDAAFRLARALNAVPLPKPLPDPLPDLPQVPISHLSGLTERVGSALPLDFAEQSTLLVDLKRAYRESETAADASDLLESLRRRHDLFAMIAEEIDELLGRTARDTSISELPSAGAPQSPVVSKKIPPKAQPEIQRPQELLDMKRRFELDQVIPKARALADDGQIATTEQSRSSGLPGLILVTLDAINDHM